jgi:carboxyl-terminal processing protease
MTKTFGRWVLGLTFAVAGVGVSVPMLVHADEPVPQQLATVDQLKAEAFKALKAGQFDRTSELLTKASAGANDPQLTKMAEWTKAFEDQRQTFVAERHKQFEKAVGDVKVLLKNKKDEYALDYAARAYLLADDKKAFRNEKWIDDLVKETIDLARQYEGKEQWLKALRLYSDLSSVDPATPEWKDKLKVSTRRIRLLAMYNPEEFRRIQELESNDRESIDVFVKATTQPTTRPATKPSPTEDRDDSFKTDWRQSLKDVKMNMLWDALVDARMNYYREVSYRDLGLGGLTGLKVIATTKGLEGAFPGMKDQGKKAEFVARVENWLEKVKNTTASNEQRVVRDAITDIESVNNDTIQLPVEVFTSEFADAAFSELDPFTSMIWPSDVEEFNKNTQGEFSGVGIQIQSDDDGSLKVVTPLEDSPGYKAGIRAGDIITKINGKNAKGISLNQAVKNITGKSGSQVTLTVRSVDTTTKDYTITRQTIKVASVKGWLHRPGGGWDYYIDPSNKIGYIRLTQFTKLSTDELERAMTEMQATGLKGLILDLRYNPGGLLGTATEVCDKFLGGGVIVSTRADRETPNLPKKEEAHADADDVINTPMVILVNQYSASASEIVSGAMKDHHRALIVGERTFGKGSVQMLFPLSGRSAYLKLTTHHYYLPNGKCIHREENSTEWGVDPDVTVEMTPEQMRAAIDSRQDMDVLRDADTSPEKKAEVLQKVASAKKDPLSQDAQLSAGLLLLRLQLAGARL